MWGPWIQIDNLPLFLFLVVLAVLIDRWDKRGGNVRTVDVDYNKLSKWKLRSARKSYSFRRGFIYLGKLSRDFDDWGETLLDGKEAVCRVEGKELRLYTFERPEDFFQAKGELTRTDVALRIVGDIRISASYDSKEKYGNVVIKFNDADGTPRYKITGWTERSPKWNVTDALVQLYEAMTGRL